MADGQVGDGGYAVVEQHQQSVPRRVPAQMIQTTAGQQSETVLDGSSALLLILMVSHVLL